MRGCLRRGNSGRNITSTLDTMYTRFLYTWWIIFETFACHHRIFIAHVYHLTDAFLSVEGHNIGYRSKKLLELVYHN